MRKCILLISLLSLSSPVFLQPSHKEVYTELLKHNILNPFVVLQQCIAETGCGSQGVGKTRNNLFGFKNKSGYKHYKNWKESVKDYAIWQCKWYDKHLQEKHTPYDECDYYHFLWTYGYVDGIPCSSRSMKYVEYIKKMRPRI